MQKQPEFGAPSVTSRIATDIDPYWSLWDVDLCRYLDLFVYCIAYTLPSKGSETISLWGCKNLHWCNCYAGKCTAHFGSPAPKSTSNWSAPVPRTPPQANHASSGQDELQKLEADYHTRRELHCTERQRWFKMLVMNALIVITAREEETKARARSGQEVGSSNII